MIYPVKRFRFVFYALNPLLGSFGSKIQMISDPKLEIKEEGLRKTTSNGGGAA